MIRRKIVSTPSSLVTVLITYERGDWEGIPIFLSNINHNWIIYEISNQKPITNTTHPHKWGMFQGGKKCFWASGGRPKYERSAPNFPFLFFILYVNTLDVYSTLTLYWWSSIMTRELWCTQEIELCFSLYSHYLILF